MKKKKKKKNYLALNYVTKQPPFQIMQQNNSVLELNIVDVDFCLEVLWIFCHLKCFENFTQNSTLRTSSST